MPALERLTQRRDFLRAAAARTKWVTPGMVVQARARDTAGADPDATGGNGAAPVPEPPVRVGLTVSRKVGNAVTRNRAKRRLRALARDVLPVAGRPGTDYVLIGRQETPTRPAADLRQDLETAVRKLNAQLDGTAPARRPRGKRGGKPARRPDATAADPAVSSGTSGSAA
jgi:ribonuclease P protein component